MPHRNKKRVLFAVGGTGGHLFPAQEFARTLQEFDVLFIGAHLSQNGFFDQKEFRFYEITSATLFRGSWGQKFRFPGRLIKGIAKSIALLCKERPAVIIGFGSYHALPILCAGALLRIPLILVEADIFPGRVNQLFSRIAKCTATLFSASHARLSGKKVVVTPLTPWVGRAGSLSPEAAREQLGLHSTSFTLLAFGGSQGAKAINQRIPALIAFCKKLGIPVQCIHLTGEEDSAMEMQRAYNALEIRHFVRSRESRMDLIWQASSLAVTRAGASTLAEMIAFGVPAILIPYPQASKGHQEKNARYMVEEIGGGMWISEADLSDEALCRMLYMCVTRREELQKRLRLAWNREHKTPLIDILYESLFASFSK
jgi:UDP-N-acetylglucosamine--N-acetylmuramyl-(pentapeptide) pyrophosphoryl-undecaprenol N-acetylglucosamine transferase